MCRWCAHFRTTCRWCAHFRTTCRWCAHFRTTCRWCAHFRTTCRWCAQFWTTCGWHADDIRHRQWNLAQSLTLISSACCLHIVCSEISYGKNFYLKSAVVDLVADYLRTTWRRHMFSGRKRTTSGMISGWQISRDFTLLMSSACHLLWDFILKTFPLKEQTALLKEWKRKCIVVFVAAECEHELRLCMNTSASDVAFAPLSPKGLSTPSESERESDIALRLVSVQRDLCLEGAWGWRVGEGVHPSQPEVHPPCGHTPVWRECLGGGVQP